MFIVLLLFGLSDTLLRNRRRRPSRYLIRRQFIIKCCGKASCTNVPSKYRTNKTTSVIETTTLSSTVKEFHNDLTAEFSLPTTSKDKVSDVTEIVTQTSSVEVITTVQEDSTSSKQTQQIIDTSKFDVPTETQESISPTKGPEKLLTTDIISAFTSTITPSPESILEIITTSVTPEQETTVKTTTIITTRTTTRNPLYYKVIYEFGLCERNDALFRSGTLIGPDDYGYWTNACGMLYLWGKSVVDWQTNYNRCCSMGMTPILITDDSNRTCLNSFLKSPNPLWNYNLNYWTGGRKILGNGTFMWGTTNLQFSTSKLWLPGEPKGLTYTESCVNLYLNTASKNISITGRNCSDLYVFGCQGPTTPAPPCYKPNCSDISCKKNLTYFSTATDGVTNYLTNPSLHGYWFSINGRVYVYSTAQKSWENAMKACCEIGMSLLSIEYNYEYSNLITAAAKNYNHTGLFWTSGSDQGCRKSFGWCTANKLIREEEAKWAKGEPNSAQESCVYLTVNRTSATIFDGSCTLTRKYICEARDSTSSSFSSDAITDECSAAYNMSKAEIKDIFNLTSFSLKVKCFLKCMGENGGFMLNGKLIDEAVISLAEALSKTANIAQSNMIAISDCSSQRGMDECDTAALIFQCGQEKAPELVSNIVKVVELNSSGENVPLKSTVHQCPVDYTCTTDPVSRNNYNNNIG
ncbi:Hypothetical predicted protein [Cloeon dipterum]|uniref:C-type lectin domain-containing protein n=1 Tax=Cloeon dipterum TaxID=197152 RepID=A0A8S1BQZ9_9INSE|nr:Hypothetical predicted protein [Cloeon dipterum]